MQMGILEIAIILANVVATVIGFKNRAFFDKWIFEIRAVKKDRQWYRLFTAGFLHVNWQHLLFNMLSFYFFAGSVAREVGSIGFLLIYLGSLLGGNLLALLFHQGNLQYRSVGASGAVSGVLFAAIALFPGMQLALLFLPIPFPAWAFGIAFMLYSIYGMRANRDNIGHEAHLGGAIIGLLIAIFLQPSIAQRNALTIVLIAVPMLVFLFVLFFKPRLLNMTYGRGNNYQTQDDEYHEQQAAQREELNRILEKVNQSGAQSLTTEEKQFLEKYR